jgi:hypothetical protein
MHVTKGVLGVTDHKQEHGGSHKPEKKVRKEGKLDKAVEHTFPASDPTAPGRATANEKPSRPADRQAPVISKEDIERARKGRTSR